MGDTGNFNQNKIMFPNSGIAIALVCPGRMGPEYGAGKFVSPNYLSWVLVDLNLTSCYLTSIRKHKRKNMGGLGCNITNMSITLGSSLFFLSTSPGDAVELVFCGVFRICYNV